MMTKKRYITPEVTLFTLYSDKDLAYNFPGTMSMPIKNNAKESNNFAMDEDSNFSNNERNEK